MTRLQIYDQLRKMHSTLKDIPIRNDEWENCVIDAVDRVLYLAESEFARILPAPVLAEPSKETERESVNSGPATPISATAIIDTTGEARESTNPIGRLKTGSDSRGGQPFDKKTYQREYMRKKRANENHQTK